MDTFSIIYTLACTLCCIVTLRYDMQMFQLSSYRYDRYFRWWFPANILTHRKWWPIVILLCLLNKWLTIVAAIVAATSIYKELTEKYKTPIVFTMRVKRLYATALILVAIVIGATALAAGCKYMAVAAAATLLLSNFVVLLANIVNTPIEKCITRWYINDA